MLDRRLQLTADLVSRKIRTQEMDHHPEALVLHPDVMRVIHVRDLLRPRRDMANSARTHDQIDAAHPAGVGLRMRWRESQH